MSAKVGSFEKDGKSYPTIELSPEQVKPRADGSRPFGFSFGVSKAKMILANLDAIRAFVEENAKPEPSSKGGF